MSAITTNDNAVKLLSTLTNPSDWKTIDSQKQDQIQQVILGEEKAKEAKFDLTGPVSQLF